MFKISNLEDTQRLTQAMTEDRLWAEQTFYQRLVLTAETFPNNKAVSFQLKSGPKDPTETLDWTALLANVTQTANLFHSLGIGPEDVVAFVLPNCTEAVVTLLAAPTAGIANPINPLLSPEVMGGLLNETKAKVVVTLAPFPKTDVSQKVAKALAFAPSVETVLEVDLKRYLTPPLSWLIPLLRPKRDGKPKVRTLDFLTEVRKHRADALDFEEADSDRWATFFHTGGTTGTPKIAQHNFKGMLYQGKLGAEMIFTEKDVLMCPLPLFHVLAAYPVLMSCITSGAQVVLPTPQGYRGEGVFDNFWKLVERYHATFMITVPTAVSALMQRPVDADVSTLNFAISGSAPMPVELFRKFEGATGVTILEGYGLTEATCLVAINPPFGERKIGSVGLPFACTEVHIFHCDAAGNIQKECAVDEIGEICVSSPGVVVGEAYTDPEKNKGMYAGGQYLRTGDLGRVDADGYIWITGRAKDLIIRGGHNIDPGTIEEALISHPDVAFAGAIGQPDRYSGELPCAYVELVAGASVDEEALLEYVTPLISEKSAIPKYLKIMPELPKTAVGKVFKPDLRRDAISRVFNQVLADAKLDATVSEVVEDKKLGLVAVIAVNNDAITNDILTEVFADYHVPWRLA